jgi:hypothetical protein
MIKTLFPPYLAFFLFLLQATRVANSILRDVPVQRSTMTINREDEHFGDDLFESQESSTYSLQKGSTSSSGHKVSNKTIARPRQYARSPFEQGTLAYDVDRGEKYLQTHRSVQSRHSYRKLRSE